jgi:hypothetical protein
MRRAFFFIVAVFCATTSFASIPRASMHDRASEDASAFVEPLSQTRVWASDVLAPFERPPVSALTRALHQGYGDVSTTNAYGLGRFLSVDPVLDVKKALRAPQMWNRYSYVTNNPILYNDPTGKIAATTAGIERDLKDRGLTDERDALVKYARTLSAQVKAGAVDSKKAVDMYWAKAKQLTGHVKYVGTADNALLVATGAALAIRGSVGNALTRGSMGQDTLHHFFFNAYNVNGGIPGLLKGV